ncbi:Uncharacterized protein ALO68_03463 [Pseudomonas syringae pv. helianthi]|uniref:Uncharacterized protein n=2 Tax=Pseudomonas syringae group genomosp. 7 TaxID=251699 RepID=A0A0P9RKZ1_9PSED|nr:Uncharacterized protein ALO68_03463 [Pseudomonas syringae pv. helianthi]KPY83617.1 Uncharacterized protein ALO44_00900 [Pseudomonas syringae pv. tagetis]RMV53230.1 hypothetical protein ALP10_00408 [Pseudomonas syringae pv. helianthi]RMW09431.1 hypothetical protein ALO98_04162 [Pseudomonas syringae pv. tagetis]
MTIPALGERRCYEFMGYLVEATIDSVHVFSIEKEIRLNVTSPWEGKKRYQIIAKGVDDFGLNGMRVLNIVDRAIFFDAGNDQEVETARCLFFLMRGRDPQPDDLKDTNFLQKLNLVRTGKLVLFELEAVYGAACILLAESVVLEPLNAVGLHT